MEKITDTQVRAIDYGISRLGLKKDIVIEEIYPGLNYTLETLSYKEGQWVIGIINSLTLKNSGGNR